MTICTICDGGFDPETEGGTEGYIGILPVSFCPTCRVGILDFAELETPPSEVGVMVEEINEVMGADWLQGLHNALQRLRFQHLRPRPLPLVHEPSVEAVLDTVLSETVASDE